VIKLKNILFEIDLPPGVPKPFDGVTIISDAEPNDIRDLFSHYEDLPSPILYIHSFFPKKEYTGKGWTKAWVLKYLQDWKNGRLNYDSEINTEWGSRGLAVIGGGSFPKSDWFGTSTFYSDGQLFFNSLVRDGYLIPQPINKVGGGRALNLYKITNKVNMV